MKRKESIQVNPVYLQMFYADFPVSFSGSDRHELSLNLLFKFLDLILIT